jgi:hypothetical protein
MSPVGWGPDFLEARMSYQLSFERQPGFLHFRVTGDNRRETVAAYFAEVRRTCEQTKCPNVLIEENLAGPSLAMMDVFEVVAKGSERIWPAIERLAYVDVNPEHNAGAMQFAETVAVNRGVPVRFFSSVRDAEEWLLAEIAASAKAKH